MDPQDQHRLDLAVTRRLRELPDLPAPETLVPSVMASICARAVVPWYRRSWPAWPVALQGASLVLMLALFGGLCYGGWKFSQTESLSLAMRPLGEWFSAAGLIWRTLAVLGDALFFSVKQLNPAVLIAFIAVSFFSYTACIGLGTAFFRHARWQENHL